MTELPASERHYDEREVTRLLRRASELQRESGTAPATGLTLRELEEVAAEAGIDPGALRQAAAELGARAERGGLGRLFSGEPPRILLERLVVELCAHGQFARHFLGLASLGYWDFGSARSDLLRFTIWSAVFDHMVPVWRHEYLFPEVAARGIRLIQTEPAIRPDQRWSLSEVRIFSGAAELRPSPDWQFGGRPNPWDVKRAFDGNPIS